MTGFAAPSFRGKPPGRLGSGCTTWAWTGRTVQRDANASNAENERLFIVSPSGFGVQRCRCGRAVLQGSNNAVIVAIAWNLCHGGSGGSDELLNAGYQGVRRHPGNIVLRLDRHLQD